MQAWSNEKNVNNQLPKIPKIALAIPYNGKWDPEWVDKTYVPIRYVPVDWCTKLSFLCKVPSLPVARDTLVNSALKTDCDYIFFMDCDHVFESPTDPNIALNTLYQCINKDPNSKSGKIVSGLYRAKQSIGFNYAMWMRANEKGFSPIQSWNGNWINVDVAGMGCCLIDMKVFRSIPKPWFYWELSGDMSEDFYFFELAKKHGYDLHIFTDVKLSHLGNLKVKTDGTFAVQEM